MNALEIEHHGLRPPPGEELFRFATVSDTHIGLETFGFLPTVHDPLHDATPPSERCLRAAVCEATAWGAQLLIAKGDITEKGTLDEARRAAALLRETGIDVEAFAGNHEVKRKGDVLAPAFVAAGITYTEGGVHVRDVPGARLVFLDSTTPNRHVGSYAHHGDAAIAAAAEVDTPVIVLTHHHPMPMPIPHHWPPGVPSPDANGFLDRLGRANRRAFVTAGHTHRHRKRQRGGVVVTEVGSTQHYPGTWAGYAVHEGGIRQVVRRVAAPDAIAWTEATRRSVLGIWGWWSPGRISDRCFSHTW